jgi:uncharacterized protein (TIGR03083 family)
MERHRAPRERILASYADALDAFADLRPAVSDWAAPTPCGTWAALDLAGHVLAIVRYWHGLLHAVAAGAPRTGLPRGDDLAAMNAADLAALSEAGGDERMADFLDEAAAHLERLRRADWDEVLGEWSGLGPLTVGQHSGVAIGEWHVHAWDLARALGRDHRPADVAVVAEGNRVLPGPDGPGGDEWTTLLGRYGRDPSWRPPSRP